MASLTREPELQLHLAIMNAKNQCLRSVPEITKVNLHQKITCYSEHPIVKISERSPKD